MKQKIISTFIVLLIAFTMHGQNKLIYVGDPMCSWCYGFAPELDKILKKYDDQMEIELVTGGLRPYNQQSINELKDFLTGHWQEVHNRTQQPFNYEILDQKDWQYDTEPACRAVVVVRNMDSNKEFEFFTLTQDAFYFKNQNLADAETYSPILDKLGLDKTEFQKRFNSEEYKKLVQQDFARAGDLGVRGFPSLLLEAEGKITVLTRGYTTAANIEKVINEKIKTENTKATRLKFSIDINAVNERIWNALWDDKNYRIWGAVFFEGSYVKADSWEEGSRVFFLGPDHSGIFSTILKHIPNQIIKYKHIGKVVNGKEQEIDEDTKKWSGATEIYSIIEEGGHNVLTIDLDVQAEHIEFMSKRLPKALQVIKQLAEK